jgi:hypothetical protein
MLYFAYGSNMRSARLRERVPSARYFATGKIQGYKLAFHKRSKQDGSGKADALLRAMTPMVCGAFYSKSIRVKSTC